MTLPEAWAKPKLSEVTPSDAPIIYGILQPGPNLEVGVPYVRPTEIVGGIIDLSSIRRTSPKVAQQYSRSTLQAGDLILSIVGTIGKVAQTPPALHGANITQSSCRIRPKADLIEGSFLKAFLRGPNAIGQYDDKRLGTAVPRLNIADIRKFDVPLPPLSEQRRIVVKLDALTARLARARAELDRVPVLAGNLRATALTDTYDRLLKDFPTVSVRDLITSLDQGWSPKCENFPSLDDDTWAVLKTTAIQALEFRPEENKVLPSNLRPRPHIQVEEGDVLVTRAGPRVRCGITCLVSKTRKRLMLADKMYRLRCKPDHAMPAYLVLMLNAPPILAMIEAMKTGISDSGLNLTQEKFLSLPIPAASLETQESIEANLQTAFAHADRLEAEAARARALLDRLESTILAKAFRGELVPQDPDDEPASVLLDRIRAERAVVPKAKRGRRPAGAS